MRAAMMAIALTGAGGAALGQAAPTNGRLVFEFDRVVVSPANPVVTLTVSAAWDQAMLGDHALGGVDYDIVAASGRFTSAGLLLGGMPINHPGAVSNSRISGALIGQVRLPGFPMLVDNPIALAEYTWETTDFRPRTVLLASEGTTRFILSQTQGGFPSGTLIDLFPEHFTPGAGSITVVPAPAGAPLLLALTPLRRRRAAPA